MNQFHEKNELLLSLSELYYSVESRNLSLSPSELYNIPLNHETSTGSKSLITKGMVDISGHHPNIAATTSYGGGKARSVGN